MDIEVMQKRLEFVQTMKDSLVDTDADGNETKFFSSRFLAEKYLKLSNAEYELNKKYKEIEEKEAKKKQESGSDEDTYDTGKVEVTEEPLGVGTENTASTEAVGSDDFGGGSEDAGSGPSDSEQSDFDQPV